MSDKKESPIHVRAEKEFKDKIKAACRIMGWSTMSDYTRQAIREKLQRDGII